MNVPDDSEKIIGIMEMIGYEMTDSEEADFVLYNTCTVREKCQSESVWTIRTVKENIKKKNPHMVIALCGCMMQEKVVVDKIKLKLS